MAVASGFLWERACPRLTLEHEEIAGIHGLIAGEPAPTGRWWFELCRWARVVTAHEMGPHALLLRRLRLARTCCCAFGCGFGDERGVEARVVVHLELPVDLEVGAARAAVGEQTV